MNLYYIIYRNLDKSKTSLIIDPLTTKVVVNRKGSLKQVFKTGEECISSYHTQYGSFELTTYTLKLKLDVNDIKGKVTIEYKLKLDRQYIGKRHLRLNWW